MGIFREELAEVQHELDEVKALYVNICKEKNDLEEQFEQKWSVQLDQQINQVRIDQQQKNTSNVIDLCDLPLEEHS